MKRIILTLIFALLVLPAVAFAQTSGAKESLRGLHGVFVKVLPIAKDAQADGLSADQIQRIVESELHKAGVPIVNESQFGQEYASLSIIVDTIKHPQGPYLFSVNISVVQEVQITRGQSRGIFPAETYSKRALGLTTPNQMEVIYEPLREKLGEFIRDYLAVNHKQ